VWKLKLVMDGKAPATLLDTYSEERAAADENILNSTRSTDFITPKSRPARPSATPCWSWPSTTRSPARWSTRPPVGAQLARRLH
jgi:hypothetical protein